jgi:predicted nucleotidyltransferase
VGVTRLPGTSRHQAALRALIAHYASDSRVLAFSLFGSLARGNWDEYSDLDLDIVLHDDVAIDARHEVERLAPALADVGERIALVVAHGQESADLVLLPLLELSIRYHALATTSPNIVESLLVLAGPLSAEQVCAAGLANRRPDEITPTALLDACVRYALGTDVALRRSDLWSAVESLHRMRHLLMELFARTHGGARPLHTFTAVADPALQARLGATLPTFDLPSVWRAHLAMLDFLEQDVPACLDGQAQLTTEQRAVLRAIRERDAGSPSSH